MSILSLLVKEDSIVSALWLAALAQNNTLKVSACCPTTQVKLNSIPLQAYVTFTFSHQ